MCDVLIVGGGIAGLLTARELSAAGASVTLLERGELAKESSWAGGGILSPLYPWRYPDSISQLAGWSQKIYPQLCEELQDSTGVDPQYLRSGLLIHAPDEVGRALSWAERLGMQARPVERAEIASLEPERANPTESMLWFPAIAQVRNPRLVQALAADIVRRGVAVEIHQEVERLETGRPGDMKVVTGENTFSAKQLIVCAGAWSAALLDALAPRPAIHPVRGQMLLFRTPPGLIRHMLLEENRYVIPRRDGRVLFGSTLEEAGFDKSTTDEAGLELQGIAVSRFPALADCPVEAHWAGLRPASPGGVPYICQHPQDERLFINAGHFRNGVVLGPASARLVADLVLGREPILDPSPYDFPARREESGAVA